jgi:predicted dehydrogenase
MHAAAYGAIDGAEVVALADGEASAFDRVALNGVARFSSLSDLLSGAEVDAIDVCLPTYLHAEASVQAAEAGKHVFCEKPMAMNLQEADAMIAAADQAGVQLMIGHCIRFWPEYAALKNLKESGRFGKLISANFTRFGEFPSWSWQNWLADESKSGGGVMDMHIHDTDFAHYLCGEPSEIVAFGAVSERGADYAYTTMKFPQGEILHLEGGWNLPPKTPFRMTFRATFEHGAALFDGGPLILYPQVGEPEIPTFQKMQAAGGGNISDLGGYYHELAAFIQGIKTGVPTEVATPQTSRQSLQTVLEEVRQIKAR